jgi:hypothetical protein
LRNHLIDLGYQFDRPDRRSREPIAHIRQYNRARAIAVADYCPAINGINGTLEQSSYSDA